MGELLKTEIIEPIEGDLPDLSEERITNLLEMILLETESYNSCKSDVSQERLEGAISEVLYRIVKSESEKKVSSVRRGDTTISYTSTANAASELFLEYGDLVRRIIGYGGLEFF